MRILPKIGALVFILLSMAFAPARSQAQASPNPVPLINLPLSPTSIAPGNAGFTLTINGTRFVSGSVAKWNGSARPTTFMTASQITATISASDVANAGTASVTVTNPTPGGGTSNVSYFTVTTSRSTLEFATLNTRIDSGGVVAGDFTSDGKVDMAVGVSSNEQIEGLCVEPGAGDGSFLTPICNQSPGVPLNNMITGDFDGDGKLDLAGSFNSFIYILLGNGDGTFRILPSPISFEQSGGTPTSLASGDFNGDGKLDLVIGSVQNGSNGTISILLGNGDGTFQSPTTYGTADYFAVVVGDFNNDGKLDVVTNQTILLGNGDGTFTSSPAALVPAGGIRMVAADLDGDGNLDIAYSGAQTGVHVLFGNGAGLFSNSTVQSDPLALGIVVADLNGDGFLDLAVGQTPGQAGTTYVFLGNGGRTFPSPVQISNFAVSSLAAADFNGDGEMDLAGYSNANSDADLTVLLQGPWPALTPTPTNITFATQNVGTTSSPQSVTLTNTGTATVTISSIGIGGASATQYAQTNTCGTTLAAAATCQVNVTFSPTAVTGNAQASLTVADNAPGGSQVILLGGSTPPGAVATPSPTSITFPGQFVGTTGLPQSVTLTNTGTATLNIASVTTTPADFGSLNSCGSSLAAGASCAIGVFFDPTASGTRSGTLTITDDAGNSPQTIALTGTGQDFSLAPSSSSGSATVSAGQSATYTLSVSPSGGFAKSVSLSCTGAPAQSTCSISPSTISLNGSTATKATVTVSTTGSGLILPLAMSGPSNAWRGRYMLMILEWAGTLLLLGAGLLLKRRDRLPRWTILLGSACVLCLAMTLSSCGGGSSGGSGGTQAGSYNLTVTGSFSSGSTNLTHATQLTLVVK